MSKTAVKKKQTMLLGRVSMRLTENKCISFALTEYAIQNNKPIPSNGYIFNFNASFAAIPNEKAVRVIMTAKLFEKKEPQENILLAELVAIHVFTILNFSEVIKYDAIRKMNLIPDPLISLCNNITLNSVRGMYSVKLENTIYNNAIVPLMHTNALSPKK